MTAVLRASEADCQRTIIDAARRSGWLVHATRSAQMQSGRWVTPIQGDAGFVDLVLVRGREALFIELKRKPYKVKPEQVTWHEALRRAYLVCGTIWVPEGMDEFIAYLMSRPGEQRNGLEVSA